jgi:hypothetical protein
MPFPAVVDRLPAALTDAAPLLPQVILIAPPLDATAPMTEIPPFVAELSVLVKVIAPGEFKAPTV